MVLGYSGWKDSVTRALEAIIRENASQDLDILWGNFGGGDALQEELETNDVLSALDRSSAVSFYVGCDANKWVPKLEKELADVLDYKDMLRSSASNATIPGLDLVIPDEFKGTGDGQLVARALSFLDGREPTVRDGFNHLIASRDLLFTVYNQLQDRISLEVPTLTLITGASGEGKSTLLAQLAAKISRNSDVAVLFSRIGHLDSRAVLEMDPTRSTFILVDEAQVSVSELRNLCQRLNGEASRPIHVVAVARDTDWTSAGGFGFAWSNYVDYRGYRLGGLSHLDASSIIRTWDALGDKALGQLAKITTFDARVGRLLHLSKSQNSDSGTLFGASLEIRFGSTLEAHISQLLKHLLDMRVHIPRDDFDSSDKSLAYALFLMALPQVYGHRGMRKEILSRAFGLSEFEVDTFVLKPLGDEVPVSIMGVTVGARHPSIAEAVVRSGIEANFDLSGALARLVESAVLEIDANGYSEEIADIAYISRNIRDSDVSIRAAEAAHQASPLRLSYGARLSSAYRAGGRPKDAVRLGRACLAESWRAPDRRGTLRVILNELGVALGTTGEYVENVHYALLSLADIQDVNSLQKNLLEYPLACLGLACCNAWEARGDSRYLGGVASVLFAIEHLKFDGIKSEWVRRYRAVASSGGAGEVESASVAADGLYSIARGDAEFGFDSAHLGLPSTMRFSELEQILQRLA